MVWRWEGDGNCGPIEGIPLKKSDRGWETFIYFLFLPNCVFCVNKNESKEKKKGIEGVKSNGKLLRLLKPEQ